MIPKTAKRFAVVCTVLVLMTVSGVARAQCSSDEILRLKEYERYTRDEQTEQQAVTAVGLQSRLRHVGGSNENPDIARWSWDAPDCDSDVGAGAGNGGDKPQDWSPGKPPNPRPLSVHLPSESNDVEKVARAVASLTGTEIRIEPSIADTPLGFDADGVGKTELLKMFRDAVKDVGLMVIPVTHQANLSAPAEVTWTVGAVGSAPCGKSGFIRAVPNLLTPADAQMQPVTLSFEADVSSTNFSFRILSICCWCQPPEPGQGMSCPEDPASLTNFDGNPVEGPGPNLQTTVELSASRCLATRVYIINALCRDADRRWGAGGVTVGVAEPSKP